MAAQGHHEADLPDPGSLYRACGGRRSACPWPHKRTGTGAFIGLSYRRSVRLANCCGSPVLGQS